MLGDVDCGSFKLTTTQIADFAAGFVAGFTNHDDKADFESCYKESSTFDKDICTLVTDFASKDTKKIISGAEFILHNLPQLIGDLSACPDNVQSDIKVTEDWGKSWESKGELRIIHAARKNVKAHMDDIKQEADQMISYYNQNDWFDTAKMAAEIAQIALPVAGKEDEEEELELDNHCKDGYDLTNV